jgi:hypothetical protein
LNKGSVTGWAFPKKSGQPYHLPELTGLDTSMAYTLSISFAIVLFPHSSAPFMDTINLPLLLSNATPYGFLKLHATTLRSVPSGFALKIHPLHFTFPLIIWPLVVLLPN